MKYIFKTNDKTKAMQLIKATDMAGALFEIVCNLKKKAMKEHLDMSEDYYNGVEYSFDLIMGELNSRGIDVDDF